MSRRRSVIIPDGVRVKKCRGQEAHHNTTYKCPDSWSDIKADHAPNFNQHHEQSQEQNVHHAPSSSPFHPLVGLCTVRLGRPSQKTEVDQQDDFDNG